MSAILLSSNSNSDADFAIAGISIVMARFLVIGGNSWFHTRRGIFEMYPFFHLSSLLRLGQIHS